MNRWKSYEGSLNRETMPKQARFAYESFNNQKKKCSNPKNQWFKHYGGKGLKVHYTAKEFIGWWLHEIKYFVGRTATVGRIDHNKGYSFDNIEMQCVTDNSRESFLRNKVHMIGSLKDNKKVGIYKGNELVAISSSIRDGANIFDVSQRLVQFIVRGKYKQSPKIPFTIKYIGGEA